MDSLINRILNYYINYASFLKIYTAGRNFTRPSVTAVAPNINCIWQLSTKTFYPNWQIQFSRGKAENFLNNMWKQAGQEGESRWLLLDCEQLGAEQQPGSFCIPEHNHSRPSAARPRVVSLYLLSLRPLPNRRSVWGLTHLRFSTPRLTGF